MLSCLYIREVSVLTLPSICLEWLWKQWLHLCSLFSVLGQHRPTETSATVGILEICTTRYPQAAGS